jgi:DNA-binding NarL/FixJ family response regulator
MERSGQRAVVADEAALLRRGVAAVLEDLGVEVVAETHSGRAAVRLAGSEGAGIVVLGTTADIGPVEAAENLRRLRRPPMVIALLESTADAAALMVLRTEAVQLRTVRPAAFADAVLTVLRGELAVAPALLASLVGEVSPTGDRGDAAALTSREREILAFLAQGMANREIAAELFVTLATVKSHVAHIYTKLGARNRNEALGRAVAVGLLG